MVEIKLCNNNSASSSNFENVNPENGTESICVEVGLRSKIQYMLYMTLGSYIKRFYKINEFKTNVLQLQDPVN